MDIQLYVWLDHESVSFPGGHARTLELFRDSVVRPSLFALDQQLEELNQNMDEAAAFFVDDVAALFQTSVEGYLLSVQAMWERGLRELLVRREKALKRSAPVAAIQSAHWRSERSVDIHQHFERLMGIPLHAFDCYDDLELLQHLASAVRHGDGAAAKKVYQHAPSLWWNRLEPGQQLVAGPFRLDVPPDIKPPSFNDITMFEAVLEQMIDAVIGFWVDLEFMRCNSLHRKSASVAEQLAEWSSDRQRRQSTRVWTPG